ncbi:MAG TPA: phosphoenolpyruvate carboxykinase (ATP) [Gemmataceae bacterium]|jgi:phosphoenolpyruvate carboxykinase (ATP)|nr:phosphoenolpyruvate carboxykinase (ATP) [Gemmataceae bacterium]
MPQGTRPQAEPAAAPPASAQDLANRHGIVYPGKIHAHRAAAVLTELAVRRQEGLLSHEGAFVAYTGLRTGRSPQDRYVVPEAGRENEICWGPVNRAMDPAICDRIQNRVTAYLQNRELFVVDGWACADPAYRLGVRVIAEKAWHGLFAHCLFLRPGLDDLAIFVPGLTIIHVADLHADPKIDGTRGDVFVILNLAKKLVLIGGTHYAGEIKKAVFSVLNYLLPQRDVFPMHCSANLGADNKTALFFGLSGTGKTTLSTDPERRLIGDDEHGWSSTGVFNFEGGCYAKTINLSQAGEPQIWNAIRFGCVLENVMLDPDTRTPDYADGRHTENTRAAYPVDFIPNCELSGMGGHPTQVFFLTFDAFGVLPPISRLTNDQAMYHFLSGYTAKVAGTETGVTEPKTDFSTCFAAPFLPLHPGRYARLLGDRLAKHGSQVWLLNTGWTGGSYGQGTRIKLAHTRAMVRAVLSGALSNAPVKQDPIFGLPAVQQCPDVPEGILNPRTTWPDPAAYDAKAQRLAGLFREEFKSYAGQVSESVRTAGPH